MRGRVPPTGIQRSPFSRDRTRRLPGAQSATRHPRGGGVGIVRAGERLTVRFSGIEPGGAAVARVGAVTLAVPYGVPGEDAIVEVTRGGRRAEGRLVALLRKSAEVTPARCRHFGRCGGCQWQHVSPDAQRRFKTRLVKEILKEHAGVRRDLVLETVGGAPWAYRNTIRAVFGSRGGQTIAGYHTAGADRVLDVAECPILHPTGLAMLGAARDALRTLALPVFDRSAGTGLVRGMIGQVSFSSGHALLTLSTVRALRDPSGIVLALLDRVPGLVGILHTVQARGAGDLLGTRPRLLWGRDSLEDEIAGFRIRLRPDTEAPAAPGAMGLLLDAVASAAGVGPGASALDLRAATPLVTLALARAADVATGVAPTRRALADDREAAAWNGAANALFTLRDPLDRASRGRDRPPAVVVVEGSGPGVDPAVVEAVSAAGVPRVVYLSRSVNVCAADLVRWRRAGYAAGWVQPVDLLPQTSHVHLVAALRREAGSSGGPS